MARTRPVVPVASVSPVTPAGPLPAYNSAMTAAGKPIFPNRKMVIGYDSRQTAAWAAWDQEGELYTLTEWLANMVSRCQLVIAEVNEGSDEPSVVESGPAVDILSRLGGGAGGQAQLMQEATTHLSVPGIGWLVGEQPDGEIPDSPDFERWVILSADEIRPAKRKVRGVAVFEIREGNGENENSDSTNWRPLSPDSLVVRFWRPHPRFGWRADSPTLHALGALLELDLINKRIIATILSRLASNGILLFDEGRLSIPGQGAPGEGIEAINNFAKLLVDVAGRGIADPASPEATLPIPIGWSCDSMEGFDPKLLMQHITFGDSVSPELIAQRNSAIERVSRAMPVSPERLTGVGGASHWGASQIEESDVKSGVAPTVELICNSWTVGFLYPLLKAANADLTGPGGGRLIIWYDPSAITVKTDKSKSALDAYDRFEASGAALRRETGLDDEDAPAPNELVEMVIKRIARENPALMAAALVELGGPELSAAVAAPSTNVTINRPGKAPVDVPVDPTVPDTQGDPAPQDSAPAPRRSPTATR